METEDSGLFAGRLEAAEREAAQQRSAAEEARGAAAKLEADLEGLSGAYNSLETHSFALEARVRQLESSGVQKGAAEDSAAEAAAADEEEEDDGLNDLLICLGQASAFFTLALTTPSSPAVFRAFSSCCVNLTARGVYTAIFLATRGSVCLPAHCDDWRLWHDCKNVDPLHAAGPSRGLVYCCIRWPANGS